MSLHPSRNETGRYGEELASEYLTRRGYEVLARNDRRPWGELDIVATAPDRTLVFVEVKTMRPSALVPEDQLSKGKLTRFARAASLWAGAHSHLVDERRGWRLDAITIVLTEHGAPTLRHYERVGS
jgi:putative endonuclease